MHSIVATQELGRRRRRLSPARCCSTGTTATAAACRGDRRRASGPILIASGCPRSCCSRPASKQSGHTSKNFWRAGRMSQRSAAPRRTTCCGCGPGSAIIRGRAICMPARSPCCATMAGCFPKPRKACGNCRGSGRTRQPRSARSPSTSEPCRSTAISSGWCRGSTRSRNRCRRPSRASSNWPRHCSALHRLATRSLAPAIARRR